MKDLKTLKVDITKLSTPTNYAKKVGITRELVYYRIKTKKVSSVVIDGVPFIKEG
jgi:hypothetical protein